MKKINTAEEMFQKQHFKKVVSYAEKTKLISVTYQKNDICLDFNGYNEDLVDITICNEYFNANIALTIQMIKSIHQQFEELGWLDD